MASASASKGVAVRGWGNAGPPLPAWEDGTTPPRGEAGVPRGHRNPRGGRVAVRLRVPRSSPTPGQEGRAGRAARHAGRRRVCGLPRRVTPAVRGGGRGRGPSCGLGWSFPSQAPSCPRAVCRSVSRKHVCSHTNPEKLGCTLARGLKTRSLGKVSARASQRPCRPPLSACVTGTPRCKGLGFGAAGTGPSTGVRDPSL